MIMFHVDGTMSPVDLGRNQTRSPAAELLPCLTLKQDRPLCHRGLQRLVIKVTGGVTFYTSFEVQPVTAIMLKESVPSGRKKKLYKHVA